MASCSNNDKGGDFNEAGCCCCCWEVWRETSLSGMSDLTEVSPRLAGPIFIPSSPGWWCNTDVTGWPGANVITSVTSSAGETNSSTRLSLSPAEFSSRAWQTAPSSQNRCPHWFRRYRSVLRCQRTRVGASLSSFLKKVVTSWLPASLRAGTPRTQTSLLEASSWSCSQRRKRSGPSKERVTPQKRTSKQHRSSLGNGWARYGFSSDWHSSFVWVLHHQGAGLPFPRLLSSEISYNY